MWGKASLAKVTNHPRLQPEVFKKKFTVQLFGSAKRENRAIIDATSLYDHMTT